MSSQQALKQRLALLDELSTIMDSIKTIARIETQQVRKVLASNQHSADKLLEAGMEFLDGLPEWPDLSVERQELLILIGSERGFCGDFNTRVLDALAGFLAQEGRQDCVILPVGYRLSSKLESVHNVLPAVSGASVAVELDGVLSLVLARLTLAMPKQGYAAISLLHCDERHHDLTAYGLLEALRPPSRSGLPPISQGYSPILNLEPLAFFGEFLSHYVMLVLHRALVASFVAENQQRMQHLEGALQRIDERRETLHRQQNQKRQEQITEELEIILLNGL